MMQHVDNADYFTFAECIDPEVSHRAVPSFAFELSLALFYGSLYGGYQGVRCPAAASSAHAMLRPFQVERVAQTIR